MTREAAVVTPTTAAGRALLAVSIRNVVVALRAATGVPQSQEMPGATYEFFATEILAAEAEAIAQDRARLRDAVEGLRIDPRYSAHTGSSHKAREKAYLKAAADLAAEYAALATPSDTPKEPT